MSFLRKQKSKYIIFLWIPAYAGMTCLCFHDKFISAFSLVRTRSYIFADLETGRVLALLLAARDTEPAP